MYSVEIKVERDRLTGETRVLSTNTMLPVDFSDKGVKVYEDEQKGDSSQQKSNRQGFTRSHTRSVGTGLTN